MSAIDKLDAENSSRIEEIAKTLQDGKDLLLNDIFHSTPVIPSITQSKILLPSFDLATIYANYPLAERLYVILCPHCLKPEESKLLREVLTHSDVVPVMIAPYAAYPGQVLRTVLEFPHINRHEFYFYRFVRVRSLGQKIVCGHCVEVRRREIVENAKQVSPAAVEQVRHCIGNLHPFIDPDFELITTLADAVKRNDPAALSAILGTSEMINEIRTCQAYDSRSLLPIREVPQLVKSASTFLPAIKSTDLEQISAVVGSPLTINVRPNLSPKDFFKVANEYRPPLTSIVSKLIAQSTTRDGELVITKLSNGLAELNAEVQTLRTNKRYLAYKASIGFLRANKVLAGSALVAGALGLGGNLMGCGVSLASGFGAKVGIQKLRSLGKLRSSPETRAFLSQVKAALRPQLHKILASYAGVSLPAVQIAEISEDVESRLKKSPPRRNQK